MSLSQLLTRKLADTKWAGKQVQKFNQGWVYGSADLGGLADSTTGLLQLSDPIRLLSGKVGGDGAPLGFQQNALLGYSGRLTLGETNMDIPSQINSKRAIIIRGYGIRVEMFPFYTVDGDPEITNVLGWNPYVLTALANSLVLSYKRGTRDTYNAGPIALNTAAEFGVTTGALSQTLTDTIGIGAKTGAGSMVYFDNPDAWITVGPNDSIDFDLDLKRAVNLTATGGSGGEGEAVIASARIQVVLDVYDIEQVSN